MEQNEKESVINNNDNINEYNNNGNNLESQNPFMPIENLNQINDDEKKELILNGLESNKSEDFISLSAETNSNKSVELLNARSLYEQSKKQLEPYQSKMLFTIKNIEEMVKNGEKQRNYKMKSEFEREKEYKLEEQSDIKNQIEELSKNNINEKLINHFNLKINQQEYLYNKYDEMIEEINTKIQILQKALPSLELKVKEKNKKLKKLNKENLLLMDKINEFENENNYNNNVSTYMNNSQYGNNSSVILNNSQTNNQSVNILNNSVKLPGGIKINEIVKENEDIKNQYERLLELKKNYKNKKKENQKLIKTINEMNTNCFLFKKIFNEGMHEIGKELLKIHELKLDKVISGTNNKNPNSLYFQIVKDKLNGNEKKNDEILKLPLINKNIAQKYNFPIVEKSNPNTLIYNVIKKILDENHNSSKISNIKKNKINWNEFKNFSAYQIYSMLNMNKEIIKKIEGNIFPRKIIFSSVPTQEEDLINSKNISDFNDFNEVLNDELY
jgi:hypothetical protein